MWSCHTFLFHINIIYYLPNNMKTDDLNRMCKDSHKFCFLYKIKTHPLPRQKKKK